MSLKEDRSIVFYIMETVIIVLAEYYKPYACINFIKKYLDQRSHDVGLLGMNSLDHVSCRLSFFLLLGK